MLAVLSDNARGIKCYKKAGFREHGRRHEVVFRHGAYLDLIYMKIIDRDFNQEVPENV
jgi:RimJ/RimL family protein N-acetyltransferase